VQQQALAALVTRRRQLLTMLLSERQRLQLAIPMGRPSIEAMIQAIRAQLNDVEAQMTSHVRAHFAEFDTLLRSASGRMKRARSSRRTSTAASSQACGHRYGRSWPVVPSPWRSRAPASD
jgi:hypothetical protein